MVPLLVILGFAAQSAELGCRHMLSLPWRRPRVVERCGPREHCVERWRWIDPWPIRSCEAAVWWSELEPRAQD